MAKTRAEPAKKPSPRRTLAPRKPASAASKKRAAAAKKKRAAAEGKPRKRRDGRQDPPRRTEKATKAAIALRKQQIETLLVCFTPHQQIVDWAAKLDPPGADGKRVQGGKYWTIGERQVRKYIADIMARWKTEEVERRPFLRQEWRESTRHIMRQAAQHGKFHAALRANDLLAKLDGLYSPEVVIHGHANMEMDDAVALIVHASDTLQLAREEGLLPEEGSKPEQVH